MRDCSSIEDTISGDSECGGSTLDESPGVDSGFLDVLHDAADDAPLAIRQAVDVDFDCVFQELVDEDGLRPALPWPPRTLADDEDFELFGGVGDHHRTSTEHVARTNEHRKSDRVRR